jgi:hypothetical protein
MQTNYTESCFVLKEQKGDSENLRNLKYFTNIIHSKCKQKEDNICMANLWFNWCVFTILQMFRYTDTV